MDSKDITIEIVSRMSLRSFDAMRCTSKGINRLTYDSNVVDIHEQRNHIISGLITQRTPSSYSTRYVKEFVPSCESKSLDLGFLPDDARIRASSEHGIMVLERPRIMYYVCKPATKQLMQLPHTKSKYKVDKLSIVVMDSKPLRYKIVRFSRPDNIPGVWQSTYCCEIFDSRASELEWRLVDPITLPYRVLLNMQPITTRGSIYILMTNGEVLKFDAYLEKWTSTFSIPKQARNFLVYPRMKLVKYEGKLGFACQQLHGYWEIWVLTSDESWMKTYVLNKREDTRMTLLAALYDSDTSIMVNCNKVLYYRFKGEGRLSDRHARICGLPDETFGFRSDFDLVDLVS